MSEPSGEASGYYSPPIAPIGLDPAEVDPTRDIPAPIWRRAAALAIDAAIAYGSLLVSSIAFAKAASLVDLGRRLGRAINAIFGPVPRGTGSRGVLMAVVFFLFAGLCFLTILLPFSLMESSRSGKTPGKWVFRVRVAGIDGRRIGLGRAFLRNLVKLVVLLPWGIGGLWAFFGRRKRALHDRIAGTVVLRSDSRLMAIGLCLFTIAEVSGDDAPTIRLDDLAAPSGVSFRYFDGSRGKHDLTEIMGGGLAIFDADGDGRLDLYFCNGGPIGPGGIDPPCRLYRNRGGGAFEDVTDRAGAPGPSYAMGTAVGDVDGDGKEDLFVSGWKGQKLYRNLGGCRFEDITKQSGLESSLWGTSAAFADLDGDGDLDLFVATYVDYEADKAPFCSAPDGLRDYCGPEDFRAQPDRLYRNDGGRFVDVSTSSGVDRPDGRGLGVLIADLAGDGRLDIFVSNDGSAAHLFENGGGMKFREVAIASGVALDGNGGPLAGMGTAIGDIDGDGVADLLVANFLGRSTIGFRGLGEGRYVDDSAGFGLVPLTRGVLGFGLVLEDLDGDGAPDLIQANGHVLDRARLGNPFKMRPTLAKNVGGRFVDVAGSAGDWARRPVLGRGLATGDLDGDGKPDVVFSAIDGSPVLLRNASSGRFVGVDLVSKDRTPVGASLKATVGGKDFVRQVVDGGSYLSTSDRRIHVGLGSASGVDRIEVRWPSGHVESWDRPKGSSIRLEEGSGTRH